MSSLRPDQQRPPEEPSIAALLYLHSPEARLILALFVISTAVFTIGTADLLIRPWQSYGAMVLVSAAGVLLLRSQRDPFPMSDTAIVLGVVVVSTVLVTTNLPTDGELGRATWYLGQNTWLLFFLTMRRRAWAAWAGLAAMGAITVVWAASTGRGLVTGLLMLNAHVGLLVVATLFARILRSTALRIATLERRSIAAAAEQARASAAEEIRRTRAAELAGATVPLLERIGEGDPYSEDERRTFALAEAGLRDGVRGRSLMLPPVEEAATDARRRGVAVTILDDRGSLPSDGGAVDRIVATTTAALAAAEAGAVTIRLVPTGRDVGLTIVTTDGDEVQRTTLAPNGHELEQGSS